MSLNAVIKITKSASEMQYQKEEKG